MNPTSVAPVPRSAPSWDSNIDVLALASFLRAAKSAIVVSHAKPDGDAIGSALAIARSLKAKGCSVEIVMAGPLPRWMRDLRVDVSVRELAPGRPCETTDGKSWPLPGVPAPEAVVIVDTGSWQQLSELKPWLSPLVARACVIDHHLHGDADVAERRLIRTTAASCTEVLAPLCAAVIGVDSPALLDRAIAEPLYLGTATDTGWFRHSSVTPATLRLAADLLQAGVDHTRVYRIIEQQDQASRWLLLGRALRTLELHDNGRVALLSLTLADFRDTGADRNDTSGFADMLLTVASVQLSVVFTEQEVPPAKPPLTKLSLRSKPGPEAVDVNALAARLGGGGHARAAGARINAPIDQARAIFLKALA